MSEEYRRIIITKIVGIPEEETDSEKLLSMSWDEFIEFSVVK